MWVLPQGMILLYCRARLLNAARRPCAKPGRPRPGAPRGLACINQQCGTLQRPWRIRHCRVGGRFRVEHPQVTVKAPIGRMAWRRHLESAPLLHAPCMRCCCGWIGQAAALAPVRAEGRHRQSSRCLLSRCRRVGVLLFDIGSRLGSPHRSMAGRAGRPATDFVLRFVKSYPRSMIYHLGLSNIHR